MGTVDFSMGEAVTALRGELRDLVREHMPADFLGAFTDDPADLAVAQRFCRLLAEHGLLCLAWPEEFGGRGASLWEQTVVREEMWAHHEPRGAQYMGVNWVGPRSCGTARPSSSARTCRRSRAARSSGARGSASPTPAPTWPRCAPRPTATATAGASPARRSGPPTPPWPQWCFLLARTSRGEKKQQGLTIFLVPMSDPGHRGPADPLP